MHPGKRVQNSGSPEGFRGKLLRQLQEDPKIQQEVQYILISGAYGNLFCFETEIRNLALLEGMFSDHIMSCIELYGQPQPFPCSGMAADAVAVVVPMAGHYDPGGKSSAGNIVFPEHGFITAQLGIQIQILAVQVWWNGVIGKEPAIPSRPAPYGFSGAMIRK